MDRAQIRWLHVPQTVKASKREEINQRSGALEPQGESRLRGILKSELPESYSHIWIIEEISFAYRTMVERVPECYILILFCTVIIRSLEVFLGSQSLRKHSCKIQFQSWFLLRLKVAASLFNLYFYLNPTAVILLISDHYSDHYIIHVSPYLCFYIND